MIKRALGRYPCLHIDAKPNAGPCRENKIIGIDPGFTNHITTTDADITDPVGCAKPKGFEQSKARLASAQRGRDKRLTAGLLERMGNRRQDDNHKLSRKLVESCEAIFFAKDRIQKIAKRHKSKSEAGHDRLRKMLSYKCTASGRKFREIESTYSTGTCSHRLTKASLSVRSRKCTGCGALHDRDVHAGTNIPPDRARNEPRGRFIAVPESPGCSRGEVQGSMNLAE